MIFNINITKRLKTLDIDTKHKKYHYSLSCFISYCNNFFMNRAGSFDVFSIAGILSTLILSFQSLNFDIQSSRKTAASSELRGTS